MESWKSLLVMNSVFVGVLILFGSDVDWHIRHILMAYLGSFPLAFILWLIYVRGIGDSGDNVDDRGAGTGEY